MKFVRLIDTIIDSYMGLNTHTHTRYIAYAIYRLKLRKFFFLKRAFIIKWNNQFFLNMRLKESAFLCGEMLISGV